MWPASGCFTSWTTSLKWLYNDRTYLPTYWWPLFRDIGGEGGFQNPSFFTIFYPKNYIKCGTYDKSDGGDYWTLQGGDDDSAAFAKFLNHYQYKRSYYSTYYDDRRLVSSDTSGSSPDAPGLKWYDASLSPLPAYWEPTFGNASSDELKVLCSELPPEPEPEPEPEPPCNNTVFSKEYTLKDVGDKKKCCGGFKEINTEDGISYKTPGDRGGGLGDISYPRTQGGRWNTGLSNTKLHPVISKTREPDRCIKTSTGCQLIKPSNNTLLVKKQSGNIFKSTTNNMSKKQLFSYLTRNRGYLHR
jgi:hypothetical protein